MAYVKVPSLDDIVPVPKNCVDNPSAKLIDDVDFLKSWNSFLLPVMDVVHPESTMIES